MYLRMKQIGAIELRLYQVLKNVINTLKAILRHIQLIALFNLNTQ